MFKLYLCTECPSLTKVIPKIDDRMGNVEASVTGVILVFFGLTVTTHVVAEVVACEVGFAIATHTQS